ncbi:MAG: septal ring lytic transglycosylase RlpA family protein [Cellvibrionaceae bacterium]
MNRAVNRSFSLVFILCLSACSTITREPQDGGPARPIDVSHIKDATPSLVTRTRAGNAKTYTVLGKTYTILSDSHGYKERGLASWYGTKFHGRRTANGEVYDMFAMTAAHKTLPIPSYVRVTHVGNGKSVVVKINDRGPFHGKRIIDLSYAAARKLGIDATGTGLVDVVDVTPLPGQIQPAPQVTSPSATQAAAPQLSSPQPTPVQAVPAQPISAQPIIVKGGNIQPNSQVDSAKGLYLQLGAFQQRASAISLQARLQRILSETIHVIQGRDSLHRVKIGPAENQQSILSWQQILQANGMTTGHIVRK